MRRDSEKKYSDLEKCNLCEWRCGVDRLAGELGVCKVTDTEVHTSQLHPAPPASFDAFLIGCNFRCLACQNWPIAYRKEPGKKYSPREWARMGVKALESKEAARIGADRLFFTGGEPTIHLPWIEEVVREAKKMNPEIKVNFDTNGFMTPNSLKRIIRISDSITFDIKAYTEEMHRALTGAPVEPVLRNAEKIWKRAKEKLYEFRVLVIPGLSSLEIGEICSFLSSIGDPPVLFLAFRPNFALDKYRGVYLSEMERCIEIARREGLSTVKWSGITGIPSLVNYEESGLELAKRVSRDSGCLRPENRKCELCFSVCPLEKYEPLRWT